MQNQQLSGFRYVSKEGDGLNYSKSCSLYYSGTLKDKVNPHCSYPSITN